MKFSRPIVAEIFERLVQRHEDERQQMRRLRETGSTVKIDDYLLPVGPNVGRFLHSLILSARPAQVLELGTSYGYSTLILADAVSQTGGRLITVESEDYKQEHARQIIDEARLTNCVEFILDDAVRAIEAMPGPFDLVLLDVWKKLYVPCLDAFYPKLADAGIIIADNMIEPESARASARAYREAVKQRHDLQSTLLAIGSGIELTCKWPGGHPNL